MQNSSTPLLVVAAALLGDDGRVLMQRRRLAAEHGGLWEFPGGKVEAGEAPEEALVRELHEELGIVCNRGALAPLAFASGPAARHPALVILLYICRQWQGVPECRDGEEIAWCIPGELRQLAMPPLDEPLAEAIIASLQGGGA